MFTFERAYARHVDVGNIRYTTEVIGQYKAAASIKIHSIIAVLEADVANEANNFASESTCQIQPETRLIDAKKMRILCHRPCLWKKNAAGNDLPVILVARSIIFTIDGVCSNTLMSPAKQLRRHYK